MRLLSGCRQLGVDRPWGCSATQPLGSRGICSLCRMEGEAVCCVLLHVASRPLSRTDAFFQLTGWLYAFFQVNGRLYILVLRLGSWVSV